MAILIPGKLLYLANPRTGSHSVHQALKNVPSALKNLSHHAELHQIPNYNGELAFTTIRNPYDALVTWWMRMSIHGERPFAEFIADFEGNDFIRHGRMFYQCVPGVEVTRYESLEEGVNEMLVRAGLDPVKLPLANRTLRKQPWRTYYGAEEIAAANNRFSQEILALGYELIDADSPAPE